MADPVTLSIVVGAVGEAIATEVAWSIAANYAISTVAFDVVLYGTAAAVTGIGMSALGPGLPAIEGQRLSQSSTQVSTYGKFINIVYGKNKIAGNIIWSSGLKEVKQEQEHGKGGGQSVITYSYFSNFAIGFAEGKINEYSKIWFDSDLVYDISNPNNSPIPNFLDKINIYYGTEDQLPDPIIEATEGINNVSAYRGLSYIVFDNFDLADWGNRIPNITVELSRIGKESLNSELYNYQNTEKITNEVSVIDLVNIKTIGYVTVNAGEPLMTNTTIDDVILIATTAYVSSYHNDYENPVMTNTTIDDVLLIVTTVYVSSYHNDYENPVMTNTTIDDVLLIITTAYVSTNYNDSENPVMTNTTVDDVILITV